MIALTTEANTPGRIPSYMSRDRDTTPRGGTFSGYTAEALEFYGSQWDIPDTDSPEYVTYTFLAIGESYSAVSGDTWRVSLEAGDGGTYAAGELSVSDEGGGEVGFSFDVGVETALTADNDADGQVVVTRNGDAATTFAYPGGLDASDIPGYDGSDDDTSDGDDSTDDGDSDGNLTQNAEYTLDDITFSGDPSPGAKMDVRVEVTVGAPGDINLGLSVETGSFYQRISELWDGDPAVVFENIPMPDAEEVTLVASKVQYGDARIERTLSLTDDGSGGSGGDDSVTAVTADCTIDNSTSPPTAAVSVTNESIVEIQDIKIAVVRTDNGDRLGSRVEDIPAGSSTYQLSLPGVSDLPDGEYDVSVRLSKA